MRIIELGVRLEQSFSTLWPSAFAWEFFGDGDQRATVGGLQVTGRMVLSIGRQPTSKEGSKRFLCRLHERAGLSDCSKPVSCSGLYIQKEKGASMLASSSPNTCASQDVICHGCKSQDVLISE